MPDRKRKPSLVEIIIIMAILWILISILGGARQKARKARQAPGRTPAASQTQRPQGDGGFFWRP